MHKRWTAQLNAFIKNILIWKTDNMQMYGMVTNCNGGKELENKGVKKLSVIREISAET